VNRVDPPSSDPQSNPKSSRSRRTREDQWAESQPRPRAYPCIHLPLPHSPVSIRRASSRSIESDPKGAEPINRDPGGPSRSATPVRGKEPSCLILSAVSQTNQSNPRTSSNQIQDTAGESTEGSPKPEKSRESFITSGGRTDQHKLGAHRPHRGSSLALNPTQRSVHPAPR